MSLIPAPGTPPPPTAAEFALEEVSATADPAARPASSQTAPIRVVVADDHPIWRDAVARDLVDAGFAVVGTAADGPSAVKRTLSSAPDVLVLDLNLPGLQGSEVCAELARAGCPVRILVLSVSGEPEDVLSAMKSGATGYLIKSARREELIEELRHAKEEGIEDVFLHGPVEILTDADGTVRGMKVQWKDVNAFKSYAVDHFTAPAAPAAPAKPTSKKAKP